MKLNSKLISDLRKQHAWSQDELAMAAALNLRTIQRAENVGTASLQSAGRVGNWPIYDIALGPDPNGISRHGHAKGLIAIGDVATGVIALGAIARGGIAVGGVSLGIISFGGFAVGALTAMGGFAIGSLAIGGVAAGGAAIGGAAAGYYACGAAAIGYRATTASERWDDAATEEYLQAYGLTAMCPDI
jgi:hypothetical protein